MIGLAQKALQRRAAVRLVFGALTLLAVLAASQVRLDSDPRRLAPASPSSAEATQLHERNFPPDDTALLMILSGPRAADLVAVVELLSQRFAELDSVKDVLSASHLPLLIDGPTGFKLKPAVGSKKGLEGSLSDRLNQLREHPVGRRLVSADHQHFALALRLDTRYRDPVAALPLLESLEADTTGLLKADMRFRFAGLLATRIQSVRSTLSDMLLLFPIAGFLVFVFLWWQLGRLGLALALMTTLGWSVLATLGFAGLVGFDLNPLTQIFPILLMIIGVADGIHLIEAVREADPADHVVDRWRQSLAGAGAACLLTTLTTVVGFLSLLITRIPLLHDFAWLVSFGLVMALIANLCLLPSLCVLAGPPPAGKVGPLARFCGALAGLGYRRAVGTFALGLLVFAAAAVQLRALEVDFFFSRMLDASDSVSQGNQRLDTSLGGFIPLELSVRATKGSFRDPEPLRQLEVLTQEGAQAMGSSLSYSTVLKELKRNLGEGTALPNSRAEIAQLELLLEDAPFEALVTHSRREARVVLSGVDRGSQDHLRVKRRLEARAETLDQVEASLVGSMVAAAEGFGALVTELLQGLFVALALITLLIGWVFRSLRIALISVLPNTLPILCGLAVFPLLGLPLNIFSALFFTLALGIAVDDTIHLLARIERERGQGAVDEQVIARASQGTGGAIASTSLVLVAGFLVLTWSAFPANRTSGWIAAGLISAALIADLLLVPAALGLQRSKRSS